MNTNHEDYVGVITDNVCENRAVNNLCKLTILLWFTVSMCIILCSCSTSKSATKHQEHHATVDVVASEAKHDTHLSEDIARLDSMISLFRQRERETNTTQEDSRETISEIITTTIDSLGREVRQEQRTTERTLSRQEQREREQWQQQVEQRWQQELSRRDSLYQIALSDLQARITADTAETSDSKAEKQTGYSGPSCKGLIYALIIIIIMIATRRYWKRFTEK